MNFRKQKSKTKEVDVFKSINVVLKNKHIIIDINLVVRKSHSFVKKSPLTKQHLFTQAASFCCQTTLSCKQTAKVCQ